MNTDIKEYYALRAQEYEKVYARPERQEGRRWLRDLLQRLFTGRRVLEVACGTGYWTREIAEVVESVLATDINEAVLEIARAKQYPSENVRFQIADSFTLENVAGAYDAGFAGFWWSHVSKARLRDFLSTFHGRLQPGSLVAFVDNTYVEGSNTPMAGRVDEEGNTYSRRVLESGRQYEILKNFPTEAEIREVLGSQASAIEHFTSTYYWCVSYRMASP